ncbi:YitT family protein [Gracilimonas tropica]|uniref:YitT family protein n=1 Tax=Gracilimonas tropica TaxID=454600 RepID=UPI0003636676|nr:YitT family protein [Gracilimonas tropica]
MTQENTTHSPQKEKSKPSISKEQETQKHSILDDVQGIIIGSLLAAFGISIFSHMNFLIGGTAGVAFLTQYATDLTFGSVFFVINIPFYLLAIKKLGWDFTIKTFLAVSGVSFLTEYIPKIFEFGYINPWFAAVFGGFLIGSGLLMLFRHKASLGGLNILSIYVQEYFQISAGKFQMVADTLIISAAFFIVDWKALAFSVLAAVALNIILAINHKPGRYRGMS